MLVYNVRYTMYDHFNDEDAPECVVLKRQQIQGAQRISNTEHGAGNNEVKQLQHSKSDSYRIRVSCSIFDILCAPSCL